MRNALVWTLTAVGLLGLLFGLSYQREYTPAETTTQIGAFAPWVVWVTKPDEGTVFSVNLLRSSFGLLVVGGVAFGAAVRLSRPPVAPQPQR
jgi:hypothetical protein